jgi:signal peptidase I
MDSYNLGLFFLIATPILIANRIGFYLLFKKAGVNPVLSLIPILNWWHWVKIVGRPTYYFFLLLVPIINPVIWFTLSIDLLKSFGRFKFTEQVLGTLFQFVYTIYMGFKKEIVYLGPAESEDFKKKYKREKSFVRDWADAIWFAVMVASLVRMIYVEPYQIPTSSMERSLRVGDYLFVSKLHNGFRIPSTPISIPFVHRDIAGVSSYNDAIVMPYMRFPGWVKLKSGDPVVFNYPAEDGDFPIDKKTNYIKRCMAGPGDTIKLVKGRVFINGTKIPMLPNEQTSYIVGHSQYPVNPSKLDKLDIYDYKPFSYFLRKEGNVFINDPNQMRMRWYLSKDSNSRVRSIPPKNFMEIHTSEAMIKELYDKGIIDYHTEFAASTGLLYPQSDENPYKYFNVDNCGPYYCPKRGDVVDLKDRNNLLMYYTIIAKYEDNENISFDGERIMLDGKPIVSYTFKYNYYWMMGDNRHNSSDSRYWGFVPESHILGKPLLVLFSTQYKGELQPYHIQRQINAERVNKRYRAVRTERLFKTIN